MRNTEDATRMRAKNSGGGPPQPAPPPWLAGAAIGLTILGLAGTAMALGAGMALSQSTCRGK
jgi:hypothetical protein